MFPRLLPAISCIVVATACNGVEGDDASGHAAVTGPRSGRIAEIQGEQATPATVSLEPFTGAEFRNDVVRLTGLPDDLRTDESGCYCFADDDPRFAYVHTYVHATRVLRTWNDRLRELELPPVRDVEISIKAAKPDELPNGWIVEPALERGARERVSVVFAYHRPLIDPMLITHELGHVIDHWVRDPNATEPKASSIPLASRELAPNMLAVPELGVTKYLEFSLLDAAKDFLRAGRYPEDVVSERRALVEWLAAPRFAAAYPAWTAKMRTALDATAADKLTAPDDYGNNFLVVAPLIALANACGKAPVLRTVLFGLSKLHAHSDVGHLTPLLAGRSHVECPAEADAFVDALRARGVLPATH